jgi:hypothetical protein
MRIGDSVHHKPSGEYWIVGRVDDRHVIPLGWPCTCADRADCEIIEECDDDRHRETVERLKKLPADDPRHIAGDAARGEGEG